MTPSEIKTVLAKLGGRANKRLGQHFLIDRAALDAIVEAGNVHPGDLVLEIGPGLGVLTRELLAKGAEVTAIEKDKKFVEGLEWGNARVIHGDAATIHWHEIVGDNPWKLISNLPYGITSLALRKALWAPRPASKVVVLVQKEVAERAVTTSKVESRKSQKGKTSLLSLMVALASESARIVRRVSPGAFYPPPKVESAVLVIEPMTLPDREKRWGIDPEKIMALAKKGFAHPRKLLASNLRSVGAIHELPLREIGIHSKARAEDLSPEEWAHLAIALEGDTLSA